MGQRRSYRNAPGGAVADRGCGSSLADAGSAGSQGCQLGGASGERDGTEASRPVAELCRASLVDAAIIGRGEGRPEPEVRRGRNAAAVAGDAVGNSDTGSPQEREGNVAIIGGRPEQPARYRAAGGNIGLFPPGPHDHDGWRNTLAAAPELEPSFRRVADGLASRLDIARVDRLRLLGNGVVPLEAAYAIRTLIAHLAARGSRGAAELVRMMEGME